MPTKGGGYPARIMPPVPARAAVNRVLARDGHQPEPPSRFTTAQPLNPHRMADLPVKFHALHPSALCTPCKEPSAEAFLLQRNQAFWPFH